MPVEWAVLRLGRRQHHGSGGVYGSGVQCRGLRDHLLEYVHFVDFDLHLRVFFPVILIGSPIGLCGIDCAVLHVPFFIISGSPNP